VVISTRERILDAAEGLIAERGVGNVSVRDITGAAGVNTAAINYHFGSKDGLLEALIDRTADRFGDRRTELLHAIPEDGLTLRDVVRALVVATAELAADTEHGGRRALRCKQRLHADPDATNLLQEHYEPYTKEYLRLLERVTSHLPEHVRSLRFALARDAVDNAFLSENYRDWISRRAGHTPSHDEYVEEVIDFLTAGFAAPA
jgi:AcrR family transcriptional regulator